MPSELNHTDLRSEHVQEVLSAVPVWMIRWGNTLFLILILLIFCISWFVKYPDIIMTQSLVTTVIPPQKEYARVSGKLEAILVEDDQLVYASQPLAVIENTANYNDVFKLRSILDTLTVDSQTFEFPFNEVPLLFLGDIESQFATFENNYLQYQLNKELKPLANELIASQYTLSQLDVRLQSLISQKETNRVELSYKQKELQRHKSLFDKGMISAQEFENKQSQYAQAERTFENYDTSIAQIREQIGTARTASKGTQINSVKEDIVLFKAVIQSFNQLKRALREWEQRYVLKSSIDGRVSFLNLQQENQMINQGELVCIVVPVNNQSYLAKLRAPAQNSGKIKIGQTVNIRLENYPDAEFGMLKGKVSHVSLIPNNEGHYLIDVSLPDELITSYNKHIEFKQEMIGSAEIITEDLRLLERLFYQLREVLVTT